MNLIITIIYNNIYYTVLSMFILTLSAISASIIYHLSSLCLLSLCLSSIVSTTIVYRLCVYRLLVYHTSIVSTFIIYHLCVTNNFQIAFYCTTTCMVFSCSYSNSVISASIIYRVYCLCVCHQSSPQLLSIVCTSIVYRLCVANIFQIASYCTTACMVFRRSYSNSVPHIQ